jgi:hypothetical protein
MYFVVYKLYYIGQNDNLSIRASLKNWDRESINYANRFFFFFNALITGGSQIISGTYTRVTPFRYMHTHPTVR